MANYAVKMQKTTTSTTVAVGSIEAPASSMRQIRIFYACFGSGASPADNTILFELQRSTTAATGTAFTPVPLDPAHAACAALGKTNNTVQGTNTAGAIALSIPINTRATCEWYAPPGCEIVIPATASNGIHFNTPTTSGTGDATITAHFSE
jgi:hypothetical protein